jgi:hypothetical protein
MFSNKNRFKQQLFCLLFSAKVGGWLNLVIGASVLSFLELFYFVGALIFGCLSKKPNIF